MVSTSVGRTSEESMLKFGFIFRRVNKFNYSRIWQEQEMGTQSYFQSAVSLSEDVD